jgi:hypothetical protein
VDIITGKPDILAGTAIIFDEFVNGPTLVTIYLF